MQITTWNVNSIRARLDRAYNWIKTNRPDILCVQETKVVDGAFPFREFELLGYKSVFYGQKSYNGVAILSPHPIEDVFYGFTNKGEDEDEQARLIAAKIKGVHVVNVYVPNGTEVGSKAFDYKLAWLERLRDEYLKQRYHTSDQLVVCGDFNIAPADRDVWSVPRWRDSIITHDKVRDAYQHLLNFGLTDVFREHDHSEDAYTWWAYRGGALAKNRGVRIDMHLCTPSLAERCTHVEIDTDERSGEKPSDHAPLIAKFDL